jgi:DNA-binding XRE family transcriptional regulator
MPARNNPRNHSAKRLQSGADLHAWRIRMEVSAKELAKLIGVTERSIHYAEKTGKLGSKVKLGMELLQSRMAHGEIDLSSALGAAPRRGRPRKEETSVVREPTISYGSHWHGELRTGADLRRWRKSLGIYQKELAMLLDVDVTTLVRAEKSEAPSSRLIYGAELLRKKVLLHEFDLDEMKKDRARRRHRRKE